MEFLLFSCLSFLLTACSVVGPGQRGVKVTLGEASPDTKAPGVYLFIPFISRTHKIDVTVQKAEIESTAATKDMQDVHAKVAVNFSLAAESLVKTYTEIGDEDEVLERILMPAVNEVMKSATAKRTAEEVLTKRMEMKADIDQGLKQRLAGYGIHLYDVSIVNLEFSHDFTKAIEAKQIAEQEAKQAEYNALRATADAKATVESAKGQAEAQRLIKSSITKEILQQRAIEKWNGQFPQVMGSGALPFLNLNLKEQ